MSTIYRERVSKISLGIYLSYATGWTMRVWREEKIDGEKTFEPARTHVEQDISSQISKYVQCPTNPLELARAVLILDRVNKVEVIDFQGFGETLYKEAP